jgi:hypothetical protein
MKRSALIILFLSFAIEFFGQDIRVTAEFDTNRIYIGDQIFFTIKIEKPVGENISLPTLKDTLYKKIEILSGPTSDTIALQSGRDAIIRKYLVTSFDSGLYQVPPVYAEITTSNGLTRFYSNYTSLEVSRINIAPKDTTDVIYDIIKPYNAPLTLSDILPWVLIIIAVSLIIWYLAKLIKNRKKRKTGVEAPEIYEPAHIIAFRELEKLRDDELWQRGDIKLYYTRLTEILRQYLENRYRINSMELTSDETLSIYKKTVKPDKDIFNTLKTVLKDADLVKFAKFKPGQTDNVTAFDNSWNFVSATMLKPELDEESVEDNVKTKSEEGEK